MKTDTPTVDNRYNTAKKFDVNFKFPNDTTLQIVSGNEDSIWLEGSKGRIKIGRDLLKDEEGRRGGEPEGQSDSGRSFLQALQRESADQQVARRRSPHGEFRRLRARPWDADFGRAHASPCDVDLPFGRTFRCG